MPHRAVALEELFLLWAANRNEAFKPFDELSRKKASPKRLSTARSHRIFPSILHAPAHSRRRYRQVSLIDLLRAPRTGAPRSLSERFSDPQDCGSHFSANTMDRFLMIAGEILREAELAIWMQVQSRRRPRAAAAAEEAARRRRESGTQQWPSIVSRSEVPVFGDPAYEYESSAPTRHGCPARF